MSYGSDWTCKCGWANLDFRSKCRNCGEPSPSPELVAMEARALAAEAKAEGLAKALERAKPVLEHVAVNGAKLGPIYSQAVTVLHMTAAALAAYRNKENDDGR